MTLRIAACLAMSMVALCLVPPGVRQIAGAMVPADAIAESYDVRPLPGKLNGVPVLNSNSPEVVATEGILVSTLPGVDKSSPAAHLNVPFTGRFDIFAHHIAKGDLKNPATLYLGILLSNRSKKNVKINVLSGASYLSQPDAPFVEQPALVDSADGAVFAGPGDRVMLDVLRGLRAAIFPASFTVPAGKSYLLANLPIPVQGLTPPLNGRSTLVKLHSSGPVYGATLALFGKSNEQGIEQPPSLEQWQQLLCQGQLAGLREKAPTVPTQTSGVVYGRMGGVVLGDEWQAILTDAGRPNLAVPPIDKPIAYPIATVLSGTFGTNQIQSAPVVAREPDTAYSAHGNYGVKYDIKIPLSNNQACVRTVSISLRSPLKENRADAGLLFLNPAAKNVFFRGTVRLQCPDQDGRQQTKYIHLTQHRGERGQPLVTLTLQPGQSSTVQLEFLYPPDATPPQVLTISTVR